MLMVMPTSQVMLTALLETMAGRTFPFEMACMLIVFKYRNTISDKNTIKDCISIDNWFMYYNQVNGLPATNTNPFTGRPSNKNVLLEINSC